MGCGLCWLCVCLWFLVLFGSFSGGTFSPAGYLRISPSPTSCFLLCSCRQVVLELVLPCVQGFEAFLLLFFSCFFLVISSLFVFSDRSWVDFVLLPLPPSPFFSSYLLVFPLLVGFLFQEVSWCSRILPTLFCGRPPLGYECACRAFLNSHSAWCLWSQFPPR